ncbi:rho GTPase-activating protein 15-like isoform X1 [Mytilus californianus]|uniref:rho GTPase-activating protein 15-like isoform X1 n=1 Tax=Mytilus californianus TaxID=6549 RepID=UPI002245F6E0|nr:rho GTPase-activating protein 15-like isoform X1 [Mytilus californianus]
MSDQESDTDLGFPITRLKALYDYSYKDDDGHMITMKRGDEYHLISKSGDWWEVVRDSGNANELTFYVPAAYVQVLDDDYTHSPRSNNSNESYTDNNNEKTEQINIISVTGSKNVKTDMAYTGSSDYINSGEVGITFGKGKSSFKKISDSGIPSATIPAVSSVAVPFRRSFSDEGDYVNLDNYRTEAGIHVTEKNDGEATDSDYANFAPIQSKHEPPSPDIEKCDYIKTLLDVWQMFHDPQTNRLFYINKETEERTWKPPRHPNKHERAQQILTNVHGPFTPRARAAKLDAKVNRTGIGILPEINVDQTLTDIPEGWCVEETKEGTVYANEDTEERWMSSINTEGKRYFYKVGSTEVAWELPKTNRKSNGDVIMELPSPQASPSSSRSNTTGRSPQIGRSLKAKSMFIESSVNFQQVMPHFPTSPPPRAQTLPNNLNTQAGGDSNAEKTSYTPQQEPFSGTVSRAKILESNKKVKKNWVTCYAKLSSSNLVFYKDMKSAKSVPGSPFGKSDFMIPLQGCQVSKATKEVSSKRNVLVLNTSHGDQYLIQADDDKAAQKLYIQLEIKINEFGNQPNEGMTKFSLGPPESEEDDDKLKRKTSFKRLFHSRTPSNTDNSLEKSQTKWLQKFFSKRPSKELLEQKGIIKDAMFGGELKIICDREKTKIPKFVVKCVAAIEKRGLEHDGIYRISGNQATIQKLRCQVDQDKYDLDSKEWDVFTLTGALKLFFRELKEPLLTFNLFDKAVPALTRESTAERLRIFRDNIHNLPKYNFETFKCLCAHLLKVTELSKENRMEVQNIAIVFGPTLIWPQHENNHCIATNMVYQSKIVEYCLLESKAIFR